MKTFFEDQSDSRTTIVRKHNRDFGAYCTHTCTGTYMYIHSHYTLPHLGVFSLHVPLEPLVGGAGHIVHLAPLPQAHHDILVPEGGNMAGFHVASKITRAAEWRVLWIEKQPCSSNKLIYMYMHISSLCVQCMYMYINKFIYMCNQTPSCVMRQPVM